MIIQKHWSPHLASSVVKSIRCHTKRPSVFFDLKQSDADSFMENWEKVKKQRRIEFECRVVEDDLNPDDLEKAAPMDLDQFEGDGRDS